MRRVRLRRVRPVGILAGLVGLVGAPLAVIVVMSSPAAAVTTTITVDKAGDTAAPSAGNCPAVPAGTCTLRDAFAAANAATGDSQINIPASLSPITLTTGNLLLYTGTTTSALTLVGTGGTVTVTQTGAHAVIEDDSTGLLTVQNLTITGGNSPFVGGGIDSGPLTLTNSTVSNNAAPAGGGVAANGALTLTNSTVNGNNTDTGSGGGVEADGKVTLTDSTVSGNTAVGGNGGGILSLVGGSEGGVTLTDSTVSGNHATGGGTSGGGIDANPVTLINSTVSGNTAIGAGGQSGGGIVTGGAAGLTLVYSDVVGNSSPAGANVNDQAALTAFGSVIALPAGGGANCVSITTTHSHGFNLEDDAAATCGFSTGAGDPAPGTSPNLASLANNGGPTQTLLPQSGSPLIDAIPNAHCGDGNTLAGFTITTDQRGLARPDSASPACDIGAVEVVPPAPVLVITPRFTG